MTTAQLSDALTLPCGVRIPNRLCKAAMTEGLASPAMHATARHDRLYRTWAEGGAGLLITGNVMIDPRVQERPGNVVVYPAADYRDGHAGFEALKRYAAAGTAGGNQLWMQISHAGRQSPWYVAKEPLAPSAVTLELAGNYRKPRALTEPEILDFIQRYADVAGVAKAAGFTGVQIHAAHGYLLSAFLSPVTNQRQDPWGGSLQNRARFLIEAIRATRRVVGPAFPIGVKLNSDDFRKGGFSFEDCLAVIQLLNAEGVDLLEISGGNYEQPALLGATGRAETAAPQRASTQAREAYFLEYASAIRAVATMPIMITGGFRTRALMAQALAAGELDMVGIGRPFCTQPDLAKGLLAGRVQEIDSHERRLSLGAAASRAPFMKKLLNVLGQMAWYYAHIEDLADQRPLHLQRGLTTAFVRYLANEYRRAWRLQR